MDMKAVLALGTAVAHGRFGHERSQVNDKIGDLFVRSRLSYRLGVFFMPLDDPSKVLYRSPNPVLEPETDFEVGAVGSWVPHVVFTCGAVSAEDKEIIGPDDEILSSSWAKAMGVSTKAKQTASSKNAVHLEGFVERVIAPYRSWICLLICVIHTTRGGIWVDCLPSI